MARSPAAIAFLSLALLAGCDEPKTADPRARERLWDGDVAQVAVAPDGTVLWAVRHQGNTIYFASSGTRSTTSCGKNCTREVYVPTAAAAR